MIQSLSTLWILNLKEEFNHGRQWVEEHFNASAIDTKFSLARAVPRYLGSLLSCYALTNDTLFRDKALQLAEVIKPAFNTSSG